MIEKYDKIGVILLAAGESKRLGTSKQLQKIKDETLLNRTIKLLNKVELTNLIVVLGADFETIHNSLPNYVNRVKCDNWNLGINESIKTGILSLDNFKLNIEGYLFLVTDQIYLTEEVLNHLANKFLENENTIVCCKYEKGYGIPAILPKSYKNEILSLPRQKGCKYIINTNLENAIFIDFPKGHIDIDTPEDLELLKLF